MSVESAAASSWRQTEADEFGSWSEDHESSAYGESDLLIPGMGEPADRCGEWFPRDVCDGEVHSDGGETHLHFVEDTCDRRSCPRCWSRRWAKKRTVSAVQRLGAARYAGEEPMDKRAVHAVFSPPEGDVEGVTAFFEARKQVSDLAREKQVRGGVIVPHAYRATDDTKAAFRSQDEYGSLWTYIRENKTPWKKQVFFSPHYHVVGLCRDFEESDPDGDDGWVAKNVERGGSHSLAPFTLRDREGYDDMAGAVRYLLSHATFPESESRQVVTWFGAVHATNFDPEEELSDGAYSVIQRRAEEVVGGEADDSGEDGGGAGEREDCPVEGCEGDLVPIWEVGAFLDRHREDLSPSAASEVEMAYWWYIGDVEPPPGLKRPQSRAEARETLDEMLGGDYKCPI